jgi:hypothetical protein
MEYRIGERQLAAESRYLTLELRASNDLLDHPDALRHRLAEDGYEGRYFPVARGRVDWLGAGELLPQAGSQPFGAVMLVEVR